MSVRKRKQLACLTKAKCDIIVVKLNGTFDVPIKKRMFEQVKCLNVIRKRKDFTLDERGSLLCGVKQFLIKGDLPGFVKRTFLKNKGSGTRVIYNKLKEKCTGFSKQAIIEIIYDSKYYHEKYPRFTNKPLPKTITEDEPGKRWQIDIINMKSQIVQYKGSTYKYILQIVYSYSRFVMPKPLKSKLSREVAKALEDVLMVNLAPDIIQCDNGQEFKGKSVKLLLKKYNIKMINSSPYDPQSQGKCER
ncbi:hypothetical protein ACJMK2_004595 [Sinanodonta woodiana]|uniref:Integrase catalytic domain-containing protein n=1 Tax=Sinanodonta woodiana TaxID=1069815 RepID=A0ABD3Y1N7_SINWO